VPGVGAGRTFWCGGSGGVPPLDDESMPSTDVDDGHLVPCLPDAALLEAEVRAKRPQSREQVAFVVMTFRRRLGWALVAASLIVSIVRLAAHVHHVQDILAGLLIAAAAAGVTKVVWHWDPRDDRRVTPDSAARG